MAFYNIIMIIIIYYHLHLLFESEKDPIAAPSIAPAATPSTVIRAAEEAGNLTHC